jgi:nickel/cobalt transporter (NicO) family protein
MQSLPDLVHQSASHPLAFMLTAILLGALHGLEPGHSKTMMAAFIIAIRGTVSQAVLLGLSAMVSHTAIVWVVALGGQYLWRGLNTAAIEPYFQLASAAIVICIALWMIWRTHRDVRHAEAHHHHHHYDAETRRIDTGHGMLALEVFEDGVPPRWRIRFESGHGWDAGDVALVTERPDGATQPFTFADKGNYLESAEEIPEPHEFKARLSLGHGGHTHDYDLTFTEDHHHHHHHDDEEYMDAHERAHATQIARRFKGQHVTTGQIIAFGLTGGLVPCPAAITVLLLCLQLKKLVLGVILVGFFSIGLAITMVMAGVVASVGVTQAKKRWPGADGLARRAPYASGGLMLAVAIYMGVSGWLGLGGG